MAPLIHHVPERFRQDNVVPAAGARNLRKGTPKQGGCSFNMLS